MACNLKRPMSLRHPVCTWRNIQNTQGIQGKVMALVMLQCVAACCSMLQCVAVCCSNRFGCSDQRKKKRNDHTAIKHTYMHDTICENLKGILWPHIMQCIQKLHTLRSKEPYLLAKVPFLSAAARTLYNAYRDCTLSTEESPIFPQKCPIFPQKCHVFPQLPAHYTMHTETAHSPLRGAL